MKTLQTQKAGLLADASARAADAKTYSDGDLSALCGPSTAPGLLKGPSEPGEQGDAGDQRDNDAEYIGDLDGIAYVFGPQHDGLWLWMKRGVLDAFAIGNDDAVPPEDKAAVLLGYETAELDRGPYGYLISPAPVLPFPFTARELWDFDRATRGAVIERFYVLPSEEEIEWAKKEGLRGPVQQGEQGIVALAAARRATDEWIAEQPPNVRELARALLEDVPPDAARDSAVASDDSIDFSVLATRQQLIATFGPSTGMDASWFARLKDVPALRAARRVSGQGGRGHLAEPWFCPYAVMQWLIDPKRRKGRHLAAKHGWILLERDFPDVYVNFSVADPRDAG